MSPPARILEVGIGEGDNLPFLPSNWEIYGVDIARHEARGLPQAVSHDGRPARLG